MWLIWLKEKYGVGLGNGWCTKNVLKCTIEPCYIQKNERIWEMFTNCLQTAWYYGSVLIKNWVWIRNHTQDPYRSDFSLAKIWPIWTLSMMVSYVHAKYGTFQAQNDREIAWERKLAQTQKLKWMTKKLGSSLFVNIHRTQVDS